MKSNKVNFTSIDDYIASFPKEARKILEELRATIKAAAPETEQKISHNIPTFTLNGKYLVYFAVEKSYLNVPNPLRHRSVQQRSIEICGRKRHSEFPDRQTAAVEVDRQNR